MPEGKDDSAFDRITQLAQISRPTMREQCLMGLWRETLDALADLPGKEGQEMIGQIDAVGTLRRGGRVNSTTFNRNSKSSRNWPLATAASRSRLDAAISRTSALRVRVSPTRSYAPFLKEPQQLRLKKQRQIADLVQKQSASLRRGGFTLGIGDGTCE